MVDSYIQLYRSSVLCDVLTDTLEELCGEERISFELASRVLDAFDKSCLEALSKRVEAKASLQVCAACHIRCMDCISHS